jgi:hypothetical protein
MTISHLSSIKYIETESYHLAVEEFCMPTNHIEKLHIGELYDYVIGTQTGALIASMLSLTEDQKPRYFA